MEPNDAMYDKTWRDAKDMLAELNNVIPNKTWWNAKVRCINGDRIIVKTKPPIVRIYNDTEQHEIEVIVTLQNQKGIPTQPIFIRVNYSDNEQECLQDALRKYEEIKHDPTIHPSK